MKLPRDVFVALSAVIWADGMVTGDEAEALLGAARATGLPPGDLAAVEAATRSPQPLEGVSNLGLDALEREFVYAIALWLASADRVVVESEKKVLARLGDLLELTPEVRERASVVAGALVRLSGQTQRPGVNRLAEAIHQSALDAHEDTFQG